MAGDEDVSRERLLTNHILESCKINEYGEYSVKYENGRRLSIM